ncbi:MAG: hypothetical protein A2X94_14890 [Bdellovibrionales bacterium GWB1_55_8]|nr:MAG: hypothetical protein A2X94_14890 [Bdellovibrionales bacterium GWB1_55_8]
MKINRERLARFKIQGAIAPFYAGRGWEVGHDSVPRFVPGVGGISLNFKVGDSANQYVSDHLEPGVSTSMEEPGAGKNYSYRNNGYNGFSCIGNEAVVVSGTAKGAKGRVTGHHGGCQHVIIDFDDKTLEKLTYDDKIMITAHGVGMEIEGYEKDVRVYALDPDLFAKLGIRSTEAGLEVPVAAVVPAVVMGSGLGSSDSFMGDYDIQTSDPETCREYGIDQLRLGDLVAIWDHDNSIGPSYKQGAVTIGVIIHGDSYLAGHGPGCQVILTSTTGRIVPKIDANANIGKYLGIGRYRRRK